MKEQFKDFEIPFGAKDSELGSWEYTIPEGYEAEIKEGRVIVRKAESKDEKMLREIKTYIKEQGNKPEGLPSGSVAVADMLAWLEKWGEQEKLNAYIDKFASDIIYNDEKGKPTDKGLMAFASKVAFSMIPATKIKTYHFLNRSRIIDAVIKGAQWHERQGEQKPVEWNEEDENNILFLTSFIEECFKDKEKITLYSDTVCANFTKKDVIDRLKALKERVQPQPKQEWSEEEKEKLDRIYRILRLAADTHAFSTTCRLIGDKEAIELQDFLRSIAKPQPHWKRMVSRGKP